MLLDQLFGHQLDVGDRIEEMAEAVGDPARQRKAQRGGLSLDVVEMAEKRVAPFFVQAVCVDVDPGLEQIFRFKIHPGIENRGQLGERSFSRCDGIEIRRLAGTELTYLGT